MAVGWNSYLPKELEYNTTYYWRVDTRDSNNVVTVGPLWSFYQPLPPPTPAKIASGENHNVILKQDGTVWTWGMNSNGQLGNGASNNQYTPLRIISLSGVTSVAAGSFHTVALKSDGTVSAWGNNSNGQLGNTTTIQGTTPVSVLVSGVDGALSRFNGISAIAAGYSHTLALKSDGTVWAWGNNGRGQLGDGTTVQQLTPVPVSDLNDVIAIAAGDNHSSALKSDGTVWSWGCNENGQLGDMTNSSKQRPVQVHGLSGITAIAAGAGFSLGLRKDGAVWAWGINNSGQLGDGTVISRFAPVQVNGLGGVLSIASGPSSSHALAIKSDGTVWAWGLNNNNQLGDGTIVNRNVPVLLTGLADVTAIATGLNHTLALKSDGLVWSWGFNSSGQLGDGSTTGSIIPEVIDLNLNQSLHVTPVLLGGAGGTISPNVVQSVAAGEIVQLTVTPDSDHKIASVTGCGVSLSGSTYNTASVTGDCTVSVSFAALKVSATAVLPRIAAGDNHSIAVKSNGTVWTWGSDSYGQLGDGGVSDSPTPKQVNNSDMLVGVVVNAVGGGNHTVALKDDGTVWTWGNNTYGQLGNGGYTRKTVNQVSGLTGVIAIAAGNSHTLALKSDGTVWAWGDNGSGQLGNGSNRQRQTPVKVTRLSDVIAIAAGDKHSAALKLDGTVWTFGDNRNGQLGNMSTLAQPVPVQVYGLNGVTAITAGSGFTVALKGDGTVWAWGINGNCQLGDGATINRIAPVQVNGLAGVTAIAAGPDSSHALALKSDRTVWAWGYNNYNQLGDGTGTATSRSIPVLVKGFADVMAIAAGQSHSLALRGDGTVWAWGDNGYGQMGTGTNERRIIPGTTTINLNQNLLVTPSADIGGSITPATARTVATGSVVTFNITADVNHRIFSATGCGGSLSGAVYTTGSVTGNCAVNISFASLLPEVVPVVQRRLAAGGNHGIALKSDGMAWTWGNNLYGQLGDSSNVAKSFPVPVNNTSGLTGTYVSVAGGANFTVALRDNGDVRTWGYGFDGQLGNKTYAHSNSPVSVLTATTSATFTGVADISAGVNHVVALKRDGTVWAWGYGYDGKLGVSPRPAILNTATNVVSLNGAKIIRVAAGNFHSVALKNDGTVWAWGNNSNGQLGNGGLAEQLLPVQTTALGGVTAIAAGGVNTFALKNDGTVWAWGASTLLGNGGTSYQAQTIPGQVFGLTGVTAIASSAGSSHALALKNDGTVWAWGSNNSGQCGDGSITSWSIPVQVYGLNDVIAIAAGTNHSLAMKRDGSVWSWGGNTFGQLGDGTINSSLRPESSAISQNLSLLVTPVVAGSGGTISPATVQTVATGSPIIFTLTPANSKYKIASVNGCGGSLSGNSYTISSVIGDCTVNAVFDTLQQPTVVIVQKKIAAGVDHSVALKGNGTVRTWGGNSFGQLGNGNILSYQLSPSQVSGLTGVSSVVAGSSHTLALMSNGKVRSWGNNTNGQLGNNSVVAGFSPVAVLDITGLAEFGGVADISAGINHSLALKNDGSVWAWGYNNVGQLGNGTITQSLLPVPVSTLGDVVSIAAGSDHSLALKRDGTVWAWGVNDMGQLGNMTTINTNSSKPTQVYGLIGVTSIAAGSGFSLALKGDGTVWSWGRNSSTYFNSGYGMLGDGATTNRVIPVQVSGLDGVIAIATGPASSHSLALTSDGAVWAWGYNQNRQLGDGSDIDRVVPVRVGGLANVVAFATGAVHNLALKSDGTLLSWGDNAVGRLGVGTTDSCIIPKSMAFSLSQSLLVTPLLMGGKGSITPSSALIVAAGDALSFTLTPANSYQLASVTGCGGNLSVDKATYKIDHVTDNCSVSVGFASEVISDAVQVQPRIGAGESHTLAVKSNGTLWAWGNNSFGQLGDGGQVNSLTPKQVDLIGAVVSAVGGPNFTVALKGDGSVWTWGYNNYGQLGINSTNNQNAPVQVIGLTDVVAVTAGFSHAAALKRDGSVWAWGRNDFGQLGSGNYTQYMLPVQLFGLSDVTAIVAGENHTLALKRDGTVWAWGNNGCDQLGDLTYVSKNIPVQVFGLSGVTAMAAGSCFSIASRADGTVWAWGLNYNSQLGDGTAIDRIAPVQVIGLTGVVAVASGAGSSHVLALKSDGTVWAWGINRNNQLGVEPTSDRGSLVRVNGIEGVIAIAAGAAHSMAMKSNGGVWVWGGNSSGQLGDGTTAQIPTPKPAILPYPLTVTISGNGAGSVTGSPSGISCSAGSCSASFNAGASIVLTPVATTTTSIFAGWSGLCSGTGVCSVSIDGADSVTATFNLIPAPTVSIVSPLGAINNNKPVLNYSVSSGTVAVKVDGVVVNKVSGAALDQLGDGSHTIRVEATGNGKTGFDEKVFSIDTVAPKLTVNSVPGSTCSNSLTLSGTVDAGANVNVSTDKGASIGQSIIAAGKWSCTVSNLAQGANTFTISAMDQVTNITTINVSVNYSLPPTLILSTLSDGAVTSSAVLNVAGVVTDAAGIRTFTINGSNVPVNADGSFTWPLLLPVGTTTITAIAADTADNQTVERRTVSYDPLLPGLIVTAPSDNSSANKSFVTVAGSISDLNATVAVSVNGTGSQQADIVNGSFSANVNLAAGLNTLEITASDLQGKRNSLKRTVVSSHQGPTVAITPVQDFVTSNPAQNIGGTIDDAVSPVTIGVSDGVSAYTPVVTNGAFNQAVTLTDKKSYPFEVSVTESNANKTIARRNILFVPPARLNVALATNGGIATASSTFNVSSYPIAAVNNGDRKGLKWGAGGGWNDATNNLYPDWVQITFNGQKSISEIDLFTLQDLYTTAQEPTALQMFTKYGVTNFDVQYWNGSGWITVSGGGVTGNHFVWRKITFPVVTTDRIRVLVSASLGGYSRIVEIEAY